MRKTLCILTAGLLALVGAEASFAQDMTFFITSEGPGNGGDLGGIEGADAHCQALAEAAGAGDKTWVAYLGTERQGGRGVDASRCHAAITGRRCPSRAGLVDGEAIKVPGAAGRNESVQRAPRRRVR